MIPGEAILGIGRQQLFQQGLRWLILTKALVQIRQFCHQSGISRSDGQSRGQLSRRLSATPRGKERFPEGLADPHIFRKQIPSGH